MKLSNIASVLLISSALTACGGDNKATNTATIELLPEYQNRLNIYKTVTLSADLSPPF